MAASPTLKSIEKLISQNHVEVQSRLIAVEEQVKLTNGRVKALEVAEAVAKGVKEYQEAQASSNPKFNWYNLIPYAVALAAALIAIGGKING